MAFICKNAGNIAPLANADQDRLPCQRALGHAAQAFNTQKPISFYFAHYES